MALKDDQTPCLALRDEFAPTDKLVKKEEDTHLSRTYKLESALRRQ